MGEYELTSNATNYWHYVNIAKTGGETYIWTNAAGVSWSLTYQSATDSATLLYTVGHDCPYYDDYKVATLHLDTSMGVEIEGPGQELYMRLPVVSNIIIGEYELTVGGTNKWHYVNINKKAGHSADVFTWLTDAG